MAGSVIAAIPLIIVFLVGTRAFIDGLSNGAIKLWPKLRPKYTEFYLSVDAFGRDEPYLAYPLIAYELTKCLSPVRFEFTFAITTLFQRMLGVATPSIR
jgi:hypothetical protein